MKTRFFLLSTLSFLVLTFPQSLWACSVCFVGKEESLLAFYGTTIFLSIMPMIMIGGIAFWLYKKYQKLAKIREEEGSEETSFFPSNLASGPNPE